VLSDFFPFEALSFSLNKRFLRFFTEKSWDLLLKREKQDFFPFEALLLLKL